MKKEKLGLIFLVSLVVFCALGYSFMDNTFKMTDRPHLREIYKTKRDKNVPYIIISLLMGISTFFLLKKQMKSERERETKLKDFFNKKGIKDHIEIGSYLLGLSSEAKGEFKTLCAINGNSFLFIEKNSNKILGKIIKSQIKGVYIEDKSKIESRVTVTRLLTVGIFAFVLKKKQVNSKYYLLIDWEDKIKNNTIFEFANIDTANKALNFLKTNL